ncbi:MAG: peptidyl-prolyl cis-trans isomerase [Thermoanaerobaculia bacterium]|nr:peptidyl-prolyl cis-trans isomerase [Thermoanaerobaculia bacterium]
MALKQLRDSMKYLQWILYLMAAAFVFVLIDTSQIRNPSRPNTSDVAATVGDAQVTYAQFRSTYRNLEDNYRQMFGERWNREMAEQFGLARQALEQAVNREILLMEAERVGLRVSDEEIKKLLIEIFSDADGKFVGTERVNQILRGRRQSQAEFADQIRKEELIRKLQIMMSSTTYVSETDVERSWREQNEKAKIRFVKLPATEVQDVEPTEDEIGAFFESHQSDYQLPEQRRAEILLVDRTKLRGQIEVPEEELKAYYDEHLDDFTREEQVRARHILLRVSGDRDESSAMALAEDLKTRVAAGEDFGALAKEYSEDPSNSERGGDLGFFGRGAMVKEFEDAAFGADPGTLVGPVVTDFGVHLIDVLSKSEGGVQPFEQAKAVAQARVVNDRVEELAEAKAKEIAERVAGEDGADLQALADGEEVVELVSPEPFGRNDSVERIGRVPDFTTAVFETAAAGEFIEAVKVPRGWVVAKVAEILEPRAQELDEVRDRVVQAVTAELQKEAAVERLSASGQDVRSGGRTLDDLAGEHGLQVQESSEFGRLGSISGLGSARDVIRAAMEMEEGEISDAFSVSDGAVLFEVTSRTKFDAEAFEEARETTTEELVDQRVNRLLSSLVEQRRRDLQPTYDPRVIEDFGIAPSGQAG